MPDSTKTPRRPAIDWVLEVPCSSSVEISVVLGCGCVHVMLGRAYDSTYLVMVGHAQVEYLKKKSKVRVWAENQVGATNMGSFQFPELRWFQKHPPCHESPEPLAYAMYNTMSSNVRKKVWLCPVTETESPMPQFGNTVGATQIASQTVCDRKTLCARATQCQRQRANERVSGVLCPKDSTASRRYM